LIPLNDGQPCAELYTLKKDKLHPASTRGIFLAESFAPQEGWLVREERVRWRDWVAEKGLAVPKKPRTGLQKFKVKARVLVRMVRGGLHK
jgi:hypothetical protein